MAPCVAPDYTEAQSEARAERVCGLLLQRCGHWLTPPQGVQIEPATIQHPWWGWMIILRQSLMSWDHKWLKANSVSLFVICSKDRRTRMEDISNARLSCNVRSVLSISLCFKKIWFKCPNSSLNTPHAVMSDDGLKWIFYISQFQGTNWVAAADEFHSFIHSSVCFRASLCGCFGRQWIRRLFSRFIYYLTIKIAESWSINGLITAAVRLLD